MLKKFVSFAICVIAMVSLCVQVTAETDPQTEVKVIYEENGYKRYTVINVPEMNAFVGASVKASSSAFNEREVIPANVVNGYTWSDGLVFNDKAFTSADPAPWIEITMRRAAKIDGIYIYPRDTFDNNYAKGFPVKFKITAQKEDNSWATLVDYSKTAYKNINPLGSKDVKPQLFSFKAQTVKVVKLEVYEASAQPSDNISKMWIPEIAAMIAAPSPSSTVPVTTTTSAETTEAPETTDADSTSSTTEAAATTTKAVTTTKKIDTVSKSEDGDMTWQFIVIGVAVLAGAAVAVIFIIRNKKNNETDFDGPGPNTDGDK